MLAVEEGRKNRAYPDPITRGAPWTIGIGHTGPEVHEGLVWDDAQIEFAYQLDEAAATQECFDHFTFFHNLNDARQAILIGMMFQMGPTRVLRFVNTLAAVAEGRYAAAAAGMRDSAWGHQTPLRVIRLAEQMETGVWNPLYLE